MNLVLTTLRVLLILGPLLFVACRESPTNNPPAESNEDHSSPTPDGPPVFRDVTQKTGIDFRHQSGAAGKFYMPEPLGAGVAAFDYNQDGLCDLLFVNSGSLTNDLSRSTHHGLYRNEGDFQFSKVRDSGLHSSGYGMGASSTQTTVSHYKQGTLMIDIIDPTNDKLVWRGTADGRLSKNMKPEERRESLQKVINKILENFPPKD